MSQITTHVLDTTRGMPACNLPITLSMLKDSDWQLMGKGTTNSDGRIGDLLSDDTIVTAGTYRMSFETQVYLEEKDDTVFYPIVDIVFVVDKENANNKAHFHIPLLLTAFGYSTYRGS